MEEEIALLMFLSFVVIMTALIGAFIVRVKSARRSADAVGLKELEERIQKAIEQGNAPVFRELREIRSELESLHPARKRLDGGAVHETPLLASGGELRSEDDERPG